MFDRLFTNQYSTGPGRDVTGRSWQESNGVLLDEDGDVERTDSSPLDSTHAEAILCNYLYYSSEPISVVDAAGDFIYSNRECRELFDNCQGELPDSNIFEYDNVDNSEMREVLETGQPLNGKHEKIVTDDGDTFAAERYILPLFDSDGVLLGAMEEYRDVSEREQAKQRTQELEAKRNQLSVLNEHLQVLHRVLRHNLCNELTVILGMAERIQREAESDDVHSAAARISRRAAVLEGVSEKARMTEDLLRDAPSNSIVDVGTAAEDVVAGARETWPNATIMAAIETELPVATGAEIRDALENLIENAVVHNTTNPSVRVTVERRDPVAIVTVEDNGPGIPQNERAAVFNDEDMTQLQHGSGLGLWVVRWIVTSAGGSVSYDRPDDWTIIKLRLPLATKHTSSTEQTD